MKKDYKVVNESLRRHGGKPTRIEVDIFVDGHRGKVTFERDGDGMWSISRFTPFDDGSVRHQKVSLGEMFGSTSRTVFADFEETMGLLASAVEYVEDVYDVDIGRSIWLTKYR